MQQTPLILETLEIPPLSGIAQYTVIWLHGLGADGDDFAPITTQLPQTQATGAVRFIFPHAPLLPVTLNGGMVMPAWFDIIALQWEARWDEPGIERACHALHALINNEIERDIPSHHIFLAGFSQGGAIALLAGLTYTQPLAGILGLSTFLPISQSLQARFTATNQHTPIFLAHGDNDSVVNFQMGLQTQQLLKQYHTACDWYPYTGLAHTVSPGEIADIDRWLANRLQEPRK